MADEKLDVDNLLALFKELEKEDKDINWNDFKTEIRQTLEANKALVRTGFGPFITRAYAHDENDIPTKIEVCYHYGVNYAGIYELVHHGRTGQ